MRDREVEIPIGSVALEGRLTVPDDPAPVVAFAHGSGSSRHSPRNRLVAETLQRGGLGTLLFDLLTATEGTDRDNVFDIELLARRLRAATGWLREQTGHATPVGYFGASTGAGAALLAAAEGDPVPGAVVSRGGRPDLAGTRLEEVRSPTLLIVGERDELVVELNRRALRRLAGPGHLEIVPGATHLFEEPGALESVADLALDWFTTHLDGDDPG